MHPAAAASERNRSWNTAEHKGRHFKESGCAFFIESDPRQAREVFAYAGKSVICPAAETVWEYGTSPLCRHFYRLASAFQAAGKAPVG